LKSFVSLTFAAVLLCVIYPFDVCQSQPSDIEFKCKYLIPFLTNEQQLEEDHTGDPISYTTLEIVCGPDSAMVGIGCRAYPGKGKSLSLAPFEHVRVPLHDEFNVVMDTAYEQVSDRVVLVSSSAPVSCYAMYCTWARQIDAYQAIPMSTSGTHYRIISYLADSFMVGRYGSRFSVAAFEEQTEIEIRLTSKTSTGADSGDVLKYILGQGQAVQVVGIRSYETDLTGTEIISNKPIAVHSSHTGAEIPVDTLGGVRSSLWHVPLDESTPSIEYWGKGYYVCSDTSSRLGYFVRVVASKDNTTLTVNGLPWGKIELAGQHKDTLVLRDDFEDPLSKLRWPILVEADKPVLVGNFNYSGIYSDDNGQHNAYLAIVPSMEQSSNDLQFVALRSDDDFYHYDDHYVTIITNDAAINTLRLDGILIDLHHFRKLPIASTGHDCSIALLRIMEGAHRVTTEAPAEMGFVLAATGRGNFDFSYGYGVGSYSKTDQALVIPSHSQGGISINSIYPSPTHDKITIKYESKLSGAVTLSVYSVNGVLVHEEVLAADAAQKPLQLDASGWASGAYTIVLKSGEEEARGSVIKN
jgi:hypothetical protein